jgi:hypothetical protein
MGVEIQYRDGCKYHLLEDHAVRTPFKGMAFQIPWACLDNEGVFYLMKGMAWNGASGPTIDRSALGDSTLPSAEHDKLYEAVELLKLYDEFNPVTRAFKVFKIRRRIDLFFCRRLIECGMPKWRARLWLFGVRKFGASHAVPGKKQAIRYAVGGASAVDLKTNPPATFEAVTRRLVTP